MNRLLLIEDEEVILKALTRLLERNHFDVKGCTSVETALSFEPDSFDLVLADLRLPGAAGTDIIPHAGPVPVVIMTSHASVRSAVNAMQQGAIDYISKPFDHDELLLVIERSLMQNRLQHQNRALNHDVQRLVSHNAFDHSPSLRQQLGHLHKSLSNQRFINLYGEPGSGREILARDIHRTLSSDTSPLVVVDASLLQESNVGLPILEEGNADMPNGFLRGANGGTLVLRYLETLSLDSQQQLFDTMSDHRISRLSDVRFISISDESLDTLKKEKSLNEDLAELFADSSFHIQPLRARPEDIDSLSTHLLGRYKGFYHRSSLELSANAQAALRAYAWPGNMNELRCVIERGVLLARGNCIEPMDLGFGALEGTSRIAPDQHLSLDEYFRYFVLHHQKSLSETEIANRLGISRKSLWERRQKMQLQRP